MEPSTLRVLRNSWTGTSYGAFESEKRMHRGLRIAFDIVELDGWLTKEDLFLVTKPEAHVTHTADSATELIVEPEEPSP